MTPWEFSLYVEGRSEASRDDMRKLAWVAACIMSCWTKEPVKPSKLLGEHVDLTRMTPEQMRAYYETKQAKKRRR